jgi:hypothetical protein
MPSVKLSILCLLFLLASARVEPIGAPIRLATGVAVLSAFAMARPVLGGSLRTLCLLAGGLTCLGGWVLGLAPSYLAALFLQGSLLGIFLFLLDVFTLRRSQLARGYNFLMVLGLVQPAWWFLAVWIPGLPFPLPGLFSALLAEMLQGGALATACLLAAPGLALAAPLPARPLAAVPEGLVLDSGAGTKAFVSPPPRSARDTLGAPPVTSETMAPSSSPTESPGDPSE